MNEKTVDGARHSAFTNRPTVMDMGIGILYFFTSHMVIRTMYYIGVDRGVFEIVIFFIISVAAIALVHFFSNPALRLRSYMESTLGIPTVSIIATTGAVLALLSMLHAVPIGVFYISGFVLGFACGWIVVIWTSTIKQERPDPHSFYISPALLIAVLVYFLFRLISSFSEIITQGFLLALPLITIVCIIQSLYGSPTSKADIEENIKSLQILVVVAAGFALGGSVAVYISGYESLTFHSGLNSMVFLEAIAVALIVFCCFTANRFVQQKSGPSSQRMILLLFCIIYVPQFLIGLVMGMAGIPTESPNAMWESNIWVLLIAIFAYDIRESPYVIKGLALGLMFEAMCVGQIVGYIFASDIIPFEQILATCLAVVYSGAVFLRFYKPVMPKTAAVEHKAKKEVPVIAAEGAVGANSLKAVDQGAFSQAQECEGKPLPSEIAAHLEAEPSFEIKDYCQKLAAEHNMTPREAEIFEFIALGRSAKYIAEELTISLNTTRTHIRHVYEKLNIHSKQELLDLVLFGSGFVR